MRLRLGIVVALCVLLFTAGCISEEEKATLVDSSGELTEIVVIYDQESSTDAFKERIKEIFGTRIIGFPPQITEPRFKILFTDESFFKGYFKKHHNIFILLHKGNIDLLQSTYGKNNKEKVLEILDQEEALGFSKENVWAKGQNVFYVTAADEKALVKKMRTRADELLEIAAENEKKTAPVRVFSSSKKKDEFYQKMMKSKGFSVRKPGDYRIAVDKEDFIWLRKSIEDTEFGIFLYEAPYTSRDQFKLDQILALRESYTKKYVPSVVEDNYMGISPHFVPDTTTVNFKDRYAVLTRGWWRVIPDEFMAGPFASYTVYDEKNQRIVVAEGFFYGPDEKKARPMREIETILNSLDIK